MNEDSQQKKLAVPTGKEMSTFIICDFKRGRFKTVQKYPHNIKSNEIVMSLKIKLIIPQIQMIELERTIEIPSVKIAGIVAETI